VNEIIAIKALVEFRVSKRNENVVKFQNKGQDENRVDLLVITEWQKSENNILRVITKYTLEFGEVQSN